MYEALCSVTQSICTRQLMKSRDMDACAMASRLRTRKRRRQTLRPLYEAHRQQVFPLPIHQYLDLMEGRPEAVITKP